MQQEVDDEKARTTDVRASLNKVMKDLLSTKMAAKFLTTAKKHEKSSTDINKNLEVFNVDRRKFEKDLKDTKEVVHEQKTTIKNLKAERAQLNIQLEDLKQNNLNAG